jgi:hypothetical protein
MSTSEKKAIQARAKDLWYQGYDRMTAREVAEAEFRSGLIMPEISGSGRQVWHDDYGHAYAF